MPRTSERASYRERRERNPRPRAAYARAHPKCAQRKGVDGLDGGHEPSIGARWRRPGPTPAPGSGNLALCLVRGPCDFADLRRLHESNGGGGGGGGGGWIVDGTAALYFCVRSLTRDESEAAPSGAMFGATDRTAGLLKQALGNRREPTVPSRDKNPPLKRPFLLTPRIDGAHPARRPSTARPGRAGPRYSAEAAHDLGSEPL